MFFLAVAAIHVFLRGLVRSDGTQAGEFEMTVRVVCGTVFAIVCISALSIGGGMFAKERENEFLPLSIVRPVSAFSLAAGRWLAVLLLFVCVVFLNAVLLNVFSARSDYSPPDCKVHVSPALPPVEVSAAQAMEAFLNDERTPDVVKKSSRSAVLSLLVAKENERYEIVRPGQESRWPFPVRGEGPFSVKTRFSTMYSLKAPLNGVFRLGGLSGVVSNNTQAILEVPLVPSGDADANTNAPNVLSFCNSGKNDVMLRPRRDIQLLVSGDSFMANSIRASIEMVSVAGLFAAFGLFLSAAFSRAVAIFTAVVLFAAAMLAPDAVSQFPDEFNATIGEKIGLAISRTVIMLTSGFSDVNPVSDLASGRSIPWADVFQTVLLNLALLPSFFLGLAAFLLRRKTR